MDKEQRKLDGKLVLEYQSGNKNALTSLVKRWHKLFCKKAFWIVKDADIAKDIAQDSWSTIIHTIEKLKDPNSFGSWALRIVYNKSIDVINAKNRIKIKDEIYKCEQEIYEIKEENNSKLLKQQLLENIKKLPKHQKIVIKLFYMQDYSLKEIGTILNISVGTVKSRLFHAREKLKEILKHKNYEK
jgi:RNA polymerase sigma-70 factor (ECF subfamily)